MVYNHQEIWTRKKLKIITFYFGIFFTINIVDLNIPWNPKAIQNVIFYNV